MNFLSHFDLFHEQAAAATGFDDFGPNDYVEPMRLLLADYDRHAHFSETGAAMVAGEIVGKLVGRLLAQQGFKAQPQIADARVEKPIIIIGMPRTGTTTLHRLMAAYPDTQGLELWLGAMPMPRPPRETWENHPVYRQVAQQLGQLLEMNPTIASIHPMSADQPDECRQALDQTFWATTMAQTATAPEYFEWCLETDARYAYRYYRQVLALVAGNDRRRWLLKNPDHLFALDALLDAFPDACIVQTHRNLAQSMPSVCSLSYEVLRLREPERQRGDHGRYMRIWLRALEKAEAVRRKADPARFFDVHNDDIHCDPLGTVERIYAHFGLPISDAARASWRQRVAADPRGGHGIHRYNFEDWGLSTQEIYNQAPHYRERYEALRGVT